MIRRDDARGGDPRWILISQIDHARLAARLAEHWGRGEFLPLAPHARVLAAISHHDDGWFQWDRAPQVDPERGTPRQFTEMAIIDTLSIWTASIDQVEAAGFFEAYVVAGHFCALLRRHWELRVGETEWREAARFLEKYELRMQQWLVQWQREDPATNTAEAAQLALRQLQFFDWLSLWLCCSAAPRTEFAVPGGPALVATPQGDGAIELAPWPLDVPGLELKVCGRAVPARSYENRRDLAAVPAQSVQLDWRFVPGEVAQHAGNLTRAFKPNYTE